MKTSFGLLLLGGALLSGTIAFATSEDTDVCDLKTIEDGLYCEDCDELLDADTIVKKEYCAYCYEDATEGGEKPTKAKKVKVCVKTAFMCPDCEEMFRAAGKCPDCEVRLEKATVRARVIYACQECGEEGEKEGLCEDEECQKLKAKVVRTCEMSGTFPHVK